MGKTLYERLGGHDGISAIAHDVIRNHLENPLVKTRFESVDTAKLHRLAVEFFCMGSGGPEQYTGRDMQAAHKGMNISEQEFVAALDDILAALDKNGVEPEARTEVLGILYSMKSQIVRG